LFAKIVEQAFENAGKQGVSRYFFEKMLPDGLIFLERGVIMEQKCSQVEQSGRR
jgi:hypothetical protein